MARKLPVWLLGWTNLPLGVTGAVALILTPQVLAARHVPEARVSEITALGLASFLFFAAAPILDVGFSRRTWAIIMSGLAAVCTFVAVLKFGDLETLGIWLLISMAAGNLVSAAVGGWFGSVLPKESDAALGAWMTVANIGGGGLTAASGILLIRHLPPLGAAAALAGLNLLPLPILLLAPSPDDDARKSLGESFGRFLRELVQLGRSAAVQRLMLLFGLPCASFALTNTLGGLGADYHASEQLVGLIAGAGVTVAGIVGSLAVEPFTRRIRPTAVYLAIGVVGSLGTLSLLALPHSPAIFAFAFVTQNTWQAAGFAASTAIMLESIGKTNPLAATQFGLLTAASCAPITYMQWLDGHAYGAGGLSALYLTDGGLAIAACLLMILLLRRVVRGPAAAPAEAAA